MPRQSGQAFGDQYTPLPGDVAYTRNPFNQYSPCFCHAWDADTGATRKEYVPSYGIGGTLGAGSFGARAEQGLLRDDRVARAEIAQKPGLPCVYNTGAATYDVAFPQIWWRSGVFQPQQTKKYGG